MYCCLSLVRNPKPVSAILTGASLALASLLKGTFLPLVVVTPVLLSAIIPVGERVKAAAVVFLIAILVIAPWTLRNYTLTHQFIPVHSLMGYNLRAGDVQAEFYEHAPLSYFQLMAYKVHDISSHGDTVSHPWMRDSETMRALEADNELKERSISRYMNEPMLVIRKLLLGPIMFWTLSSTPTATLFSALMQIPLLILFVMAVIRTLREEGLVSISALPIVMITVYFASHIPVMALARFSVVLIPTMLVYVATLFSPSNIGNPLHGFDR